MTARRESMMVAAAGRSGAVAAAVVLTVCLQAAAAGKTEWLAPDKGSVKALRAYVKELFGEGLAAQPIQVLVNVAQVDESRILRAPPCAFRRRMGPGQRRLEIR